MKKIDWIISLVIIFIIFIYFFTVTHENFNSSENSFIDIYTFEKIQHDLLAKTIPKYLFRTSEFKKNELPDEIQHVLSDTIKNNPEYIQIYLDAVDREYFIKKYYPEYYRYYDILIPGAFKADLFRLLIIYHYGGIYNDIGHTYLTKIDNIIYKDDEFVMNKDSPEHSTIYSLCNGFLAAYPKHPLMKKMIDFLIQNISKKHYGINSLDITGPTAYGRAFNEFFNRPQETEVHSGNYILNGYKIKVPIQEWATPTGFIVYNNKRVIQLKFNNYSNIMYKKKDLTHYSILWGDKNIYKDNYPL